MKNKFISVLLAAVLLLSLLGGCKQNGGTTLRVNEVTHSIFYAPFYAAINLGFFNEKNIEIELTNGGGSDKSMTALLSGQADIGFMGPETAVYVFSEGQSDYPVVIAQVTRRDGSFLVGKEKDENFTFEKLRGKSVIGGRKGGMPEMTLEYALRKNGIDPSRDLTLRTDVSFDLMGGAFMSGSDDYVALFEPNASTMEMANEGYIVASVGAETDFVAYTAMMVLQSFRDKNKQTVQDFVDALAKGQKWVDEHSAEEIAAAIAPSFPDSDAELIKKVVSNYKKINAWNTVPKLEESNFEQLLKVISDAGIDVKSADYAKIVDNSFADKIK